MSKLDHIADALKNGIGGDTDGAPADAVLAEIRRCAAAWAPEARLLGNVRAEDIVRAVAEVLGREPRAQWSAWNEVLGWINTQQQKMISKGDLYAAVMEMRPKETQALDALFNDAKRAGMKAAEDAAADVALLIAPEGMSPDEEAVFRRGYGVAQNAILGAIRARAEEVTL